MNTDIKIDLGSVKIHKHVLEDIITKSLDDIDGVTLVKPNFTDKLKAIVGANGSAIEIRTDDEQDLLIRVKVNVSYGKNIPDTARQIQEIVKQDIKKTLEINVKDINVDIEGIERG